jgi:AcrR family transcriptional regulator
MIERPAAEDRPPAPALQRRADARLRADRLLYRYFPTKGDLIEAVFAQFRGRWDADKAHLLADRSVALADRLLAFYMAYAGRHGAYPGARLFMHAALAGIDLPRRYGEDLDALVLGPVLDALRAETGLGPAPRPLVRAERELAMGLHGAIVFVGIRRWIYRIDIDDARHREVVNGLIRTWLPGALAAIK